MPIAIKHGAPVFRRHFRRIIWKNEAWDHWTWAHALSLSVGDFRSLLYGDALPTFPELRRILYFYDFNPFGLVDIWRQDLTRQIGCRLETSLSGFLEAFRENEFADASPADNVFFERLLKALDD